MAMKIVHVSAHEGLSGAGRAAQRLHRALLEAGAESVLAVRVRTTDDPATVGGSSLLERTWAHNLPRLDGLALRFRPGRRGDLFSTCAFPDPFGRRVHLLAPDVVNVHWIGQGFARPETLRAFGAPLVWTCHDHWAFTGGCHYPGECGRYEAGCGRCPALGSDDPRDLSHRQYLRKGRAYAGLEFTIVAPSRWLAERARSSPLLAGRHVETIPNGLDGRVFKPVERDAARTRWNVSTEARVVLFAALGGPANPAKGYDLLAAALQHLARSGRAERLELLVVGADSVAGAPAAGVPVRCLGRVSDDGVLADVYACADVVAVPSREDNLPSTVMEAMACGRPAVGFRTGGIPDMIDDRVNGALAPPFDVPALAEALAWATSDGPRWRGLSAAARERVERDFTKEIQARRYLSLYERVCAGAGASRKRPAR